MITYLKCTEFIKKIFVTVLFCMAVLLVGCGGDTNPGEGSLGESALSTNITSDIQEAETDETQPVDKDQTEEETESSGEDKVTEETLEEAELLAVLENVSGYTMEGYVCVDMDHDGAKEMIGVYPDENGFYRTWYCSSDRENCLEVHSNPQIMDACVIKLLEVDGATHVAVNGLRLVGTGKNNTILALRDGEISSLVLNQSGYVSMSEEGDILLEVEAYDAEYMDGYMLGHTWKDTYLYFDGEVYKEYGAATISEEEYLTYENAQSVKDTIEQMVNPSGKYQMEYAYFRRSNGIMHIKCNVNHSSDSIMYYYYTVRFEDGVLDEESGVMNSGWMYESFSSLEVTY